MEYQSKGSALKRDTRVKIKRNFPRHKIAQDQRKPSEAV